MMRTARPFVVALLAGLCLASGGCARWNLAWLRGEGLQDGLANWSAGLRPQSKESGTGTSEKAREIERHLGFR